MKRKGIFPVVALALLVFASAASSQMLTERRIPEAPIQVGTVTEKSPAVSLRAVGKQVAPGEFEVDPESIRDKRLIIPNDQKRISSICIGKWINGECRGIYIKFGNSTIPELKNDLELL